MQRYGCLGPSTRSPTSTQRSMCQKVLSAPHQKAARPSMAPMPPLEMLQWGSPWITPMVAAAVRLGLSSLSMGIQLQAFRGNFRAIKKIPHCRANTWGPHSHGSLLPDVFLSVKKNPAIIPSTLSHMGGSAHIHQTMHLETSAAGCTRNWLAPTSSFPQFPQGCVSSCNYCRR